ncbi:hypothetical protein ABRP29_06010 [Pseudomonas sp. WHRI 8822A]|uniref:hypothetical protein n=1 Tax=Pseudomonas sp. WHRI 8822A TaxID=3162568 RepID=UPI0032F00FB7
MSEIRSVLIASVLGVAGVVYTAHLSFVSSERQIESQVAQTRAVNAQALATQLRDKSEAFLLATSRAFSYGSTTSSYDEKEFAHLETAAMEAALSLQPYASPDLAAEASSLASFIFTSNMRDASLLRSDAFTVEASRLQLRFSELLTIELQALNDSAIPGYEKSRKSFDADRTKVLEMIDSEAERLKKSAKPKD